MKKLLYSVSTALLLLSCNTEDPSLEAEPGKGGNVITFVGRTFPETRTEIGVKDGNSYPVLWSSGDRIGIISPVETLFQNASATLNASDAGKNSGIFVLETETAVESSMDLIVYYPYSSYTTYGDGALHASVPMEQRQARPGDSSHTGKYTLAYDKTTIDPAAAAPGKSPSASFSLRHAVRRNILDPYLDPGQRRANWWLGLASRGSMLNNWTPWCNSDVILCFLLMEKDQERLDRAMAQSVQSMDLFLNYIQKDGACEEGPAYWGAAAGKVYDYLQILYDASDGAFSLFGNERIRKMGEFVSRSYIGNGYVVNFADAGARLNNPSELIWNYGHAVGSREMTDFALYCLADPASGKFRNPVITGNDAYRALETVRFNPLIREAADSLNRLAAETAPAEVRRNLRRGVPPATWYPETEMCFMRNPSGWFLGAKGGYNNESHNHNDVGSCVVYVRDIPVLVDAGVGTYTKQTFNHDRYKIWSMQCDWHNLPMINGAAQPAGAQYRSKNTSCDLSKGMFSLDLADAYPPESGCRKWVRTYRLAPKGAPSVTITDSFALDARTQPDVEHFLVKGSVVLPGGTHQGRTLPDGELLILCDEGLVVKMTFPASLKASVDVMELTDRRFSGVWGPSLRRINLASPPDAPAKGSYEFRITELGKK